MSLQVWLPLNGNLNNLGLSTATVEGTSISYIANGKIGQCAQSINNSYINTNYGKNNIIDNITICCWFRFDTIETGKIIFGSSNGNNQRCYLGYQSYGFCIAYGGTSWSSGNGSTQTTSAGVWNHLTLTILNKVMSLYINGEKQGLSISLSSAPTFYSNIYALDYGAGTSYRPKGSMNDFRIYDECLSDKLIKEISKGLVLHYKLSGNYGENNNLILNSLDKNLDNESYLVKRYNLSEPLVANEIYTYTIKAELSIEKKMIGVWVAGGSYCAGTSQKNSTGIYTVTFTASSNMDGKTFINVYCSNNTGTLGSTPVTGSCYIDSVKLEKGSKATPWIPNPSDLGETGLVEYDCSGYNNKGIKNKNIDVSTDTTRYNVSSIFDGTTYINYNHFISSTTLMPEFTLCTWIKRTYDDATTRYFFYGPIRTYIYTDFKFRVSWQASDNVDYDAGNTWAPGVTLPKDEWHFASYVFKDGLFSFYLDGLLKSTNSRNPYIKGVLSSIGSVGSSFIGSLSDMRAYMTALSAEDIKELYQTTQSIDKNGNIYTYEYIEE